MAKAPTPAEGARDATDTTEVKTAVPEQAPIVPEPYAPGEATAPGLNGVDDVRVDVETTGEFMLQDPYTLDVVKHEGSSNVRLTTFIQEKLDEKQLKLA